MQKKSPYKSRTCKWVWKWKMRSTPRWGWDIPTPATPLKTHTVKVNGHPSPPLSPLEAAPNTPII